MFIDPKKVLDQVVLNEGMMVGDFGVGSGFYSLEIANKIGDDGRVFAVDVQKDLLDRLKTQFLEKGLKNIELILADFEKLGSTKLADGLLDLAILSNVLFQLDDKEGAVKEISRVLKSSGTILVIDWFNSFDNLGPTSEMVFEEEKAVSLFEKMGFILEKHIDAGENHYGLIFRKK